MASKEKAAEFSANVSKESKTKDTQFQAIMTPHIQALINTIATLLTAITAATKNGDGGSMVVQAAAAAAAAEEEEASACSNSRVTWEHTAQRMTINLLA